MEAPSSAKFLGRKVKEVSEEQSRLTQTHN
jgi:hypothetical protein